MVKIRKSFTVECSRISVIDFFAIAAIFETAIQDVKINTFMSVIMISLQLYLSCVQICLVMRCLTGYNEAQKYSLCYFHASPLFFSRDLCNI